MLRVLGALALAAPLLACGGDGPAADPRDLAFAAIGSPATPAGRGSFRFGAASAATQIEDRNPAVDWYVWTAPAPDGLGNGTFVGDAARGYTKALEDLELLAELELDSYRFSIEWARIEPARDQIDETAVQHYRAFLEGLVARGIRPMVTVHHFSNPIWVHDPRDRDCAQGPRDENLCGLGHAVGGPLVIEEMAEHARLLAARFGDLVDEWCTVNEPVNYVFFAYGVGQFPPGKFGILQATTDVAPVYRDLLSAHAAMYRAIKEADTTDADGDGQATAIGIAKEANVFVPSARNQPSDAPADVAARDRLLWLYQYLFVEALRQGSFDADIDGALDEPHPEWRDTLDWLGVQYYFRAGVTGTPGIILGFTPCLAMYDFGSCVPPRDPTYVVPAMAYEHDPAGVHAVLTDFATRWPGLPMIVTESGIATEVGARRAEIVVRELEAITRAIAAGADVRGYYHWSLYDNFEWAFGFGPRFGLYTVDYATFARTPTEGATVYGEIAGARRVTAAQRDRYGGDGPMTPEP
jgi:beta-glucosidase/6-phospho-beta-glucosidase/beta-galactosidase